MNIAEKNADRITPHERIELLRRESDRRPPWAGLAAVLALCLLAYQNVQHRDAMVALKEQHASELAAKDKELALYKPGPRKMACRQYSIWMEGQSITHCVNTEARM